jgi:hypothetical protein
MRARLRMAREVTSAAPPHPCRAPATRPHGVVRNLPICATFAPEEPPHAEASRVSPTTPTMASVRAARVVIHALYVAILISAPSSSVVWVLTLLY